MNLQENWKQYIELTKERSSSHLKLSQIWDRVNNVLNLSTVILASVTTFLSITNDIPAIIIPILAGALTLLSLVSVFLRAVEKKQIHVNI